VKPPVKRKAAPHLQSLSQTLLDYLWGKLLHSLFSPSCILKTFICAFAAALMTFYFEKGTSLLLSQKTLVEILGPWSLRQRVGWRHTGCLLSEREKE
jgi:hypothetical protein